MFRLPFRLMSPAGARARLTVLTFHRVLAQPDPLFPELPSAAEFEEQMGWVRDWFNVLPLDEAIERLFAGALPSRALAISFDDGYSDNEQIAAPLLQRLGLPATFFVASGYLDGSCMWNDQVVAAVRACRSEAMDLSPLGLESYPVGTTAERQQTIVRLVLDIKHFEIDKRRELVDAILESQRSAAPVDLMMRPTQLRGLRAMGMQVGAHTVTHPILTRLDAQAAFDEIRRSKEQLEALLGEPVTLFAYPNGMPDRDYAAVHAEMVRRSGFRAAVTTAAGAGSAASDPYQLPRFAPWDRAKLRYGARLLANYRSAQRLAT